MNIYDSIDSPQTFYIAITNDKTYDTAYAMPYSILNEPGMDDIDDLTKHLVNAVKERCNALGWSHPDLSYHIDFYCPCSSGMPVKLLLILQHRVCNELTIDYQLSHKTTTPTNK